MWDQTRMAIAMHTNMIRDLETRQLTFQSLTKLLNQLRAIETTNQCPECER